ncbi:peptidase, partial [Lactobacillus reuteri]|uniref:vWA domain-containing protein n=1 Tax=Limosilactobacillus reuteri TaxID=1598 RepID=UPI001652537E
MSLVDFLSRLHQNDGSNNHVTSAQRIREAIIIILQKQRLFGEVLLQLPRENDLQLPAMMGLRWEDNRLVLVINPEKLANVRNDELQSLLEHEDIKRSWMHPLRYASYPHQDLVQIATDVAVNQYLTEPPQGTVTLSQLEKALRQKLMPKLDSQDYLNILEQLPAEQQEKLHQPGLKLNGGKQEENATADEVKIADTHNGWQESKTSQQISNQVVRLANIKQILNRSWRQTPQRDRGLLPGNVRSQLQKVQKTKIVDWRQVFRHQFGLIARGQVNSHARFNRRQPLRMDLPGKVTRLDPAIDIFVDNSGSVTDQEIVQTLTTLEKMLKKTKLTANVYSFDARVTTKQKLHDGKKLDFRRTGGGGTSFQCIFDYLHQHHLTKRNRIIIIITDGWGEERINN